MQNHDSDRTSDDGVTAAMPCREAISIGAGRTAVHLQLMSQGRDFLVRITGGDAHVGAVAVCSGIRGQDHGQPAKGVVELPNHKEGPLAAEAAETLAAASGRACAAVVGIHQDNATPKEIHDIVVHVRQGLQQLVVALTQKEKP